MKFQTKTIDQKTYTKLNKNAQTPDTFLQSTAYANLRSSCNETVFYVHTTIGSETILTAAIQKTKSRFRTFLHLPHGPNFFQTPPTAEAWGNFLDFYTDLGKKQKCDLVRISPLVETKNKTLNNIFIQKKWKPSPAYLINPEHSLILDITPTEDEIWAKMKKSTRYEVRKSQKQDFEIKIGNTASDIDIFWNLHAETVKRQNFTPFPKSLTQKQIQAFGDGCQIFSVFHQGNPLSAAVIIFDTDSAYYHQGASVFSKLPASHAALWEAIKFAKNRGCTKFNFWGIVDDSMKLHPWYGLSRFKKGFGGTETKYIHAHEFPLSPKYPMITLLEKYRRWRKGY